MAEIEAQVAQDGLTAVCSHTENTSTRGQTKTQDTNPSRILV